MRIVALIPKRQQPQPQTLPLLSPPLYTVGWFAKTQRFSENVKHLYQNTEQKSTTVFSTISNPLTPNVRAYPWGALHFIEKEAALVPRQI